MASPSVLSFLRKDREFIAVWPGDDECVMEMFGERIYVPPSDEVADHGQKGSKYRFPPGKDASGRPMGGTVALSDRWIRDPETQADQKLFDSEKFIRSIYERNPSLIARGLTVVESAEHVEAARKMGRPKWEAAKVKDWENTIRIEMTRREHWKKQGQPAPESSSAQSVKEAIAGLKRFNSVKRSTIDDKDLVEALSGFVTPFEPAPLEVAEEPVDAQKAGADLYDAAREAGVFLKKEEIAGLLKQDIDVMDAVAEKIRTAKAV
jgi:hypothetical protein